MNRLVSYPLFDKLFSEIENKEVRTIDIAFIGNTFRTMGQNFPIEKVLSHYEEVMALIIHFYGLANKGKLSDFIPFDGKGMPGGKGILYNISNLPPILQEIIQDYLKIYCV